MIRKVVVWAVFLGILALIFWHFAPKGPRPPIQSAPTASDTTLPISSPTTAVAPQPASPAAESAERSGPSENK